MRLNRLGLFLAAALIAAAHARAESVTLTAGQPLAFGGGQSLELIEVDDSRCPASARCASAGYVRLLLHWRSSANAAPMRLTLATTKADGQTREACLQGTLVRLRSVSPQPKSSTPIPLIEYRVTFTLTTCSDEHAAS